MSEFREVAVLSRRVMVISDNWRDTDNLVASS